MAVQTDTSARLMSRGRGSGSVGAPLALMWSPAQRSSDVQRGAVSITTAVGNTTSVVSHPLAEATNAHTLNTFCSRRKHETVAYKTHLYNDGWIRRRPMRVGDSQNLRWVVPVQGFQVRGVPIRVIRRHL